MCAVLHYGSNPHRNLPSVVQAVGQPEILPKLLNQLSLRTFHDGMDQRQSGAAAMGLCQVVIDGKNLVRWDWVGYYRPVARVKCPGRPF